jgi:hypothetical protein
VAKRKSAKAAGRPARRTGERLSKNRTFRVREQLDEQLFHAAGSSGRSVSEEIEFRLEQSFTKQESMLEALDLIYGRENAALSMVFAELGRAIGMWAPLAATVRKKKTQNASWLDDPYLFDQFKLALNALLEGVRPEGEADLPKNSLIPRLGMEEPLTRLGEILAGRILASSNPILEKTGWAALVSARFSPSVKNHLLEAARK